MLGNYEHYQIIPPHQFIYPSKNLLVGMCVVGEGFSGMNKTRQCSKCPLDTYNNDQGSICTSCKKGYDTNGVCVSEFDIVWSLKKRK